MDRRTMRDFWDERAAEDPYYFVDNRLEYGEADLRAFWAHGQQDLDTILDQLGLELARTDDVVEIGCGVGRLTRALAERAASVRAIDVSSRMLGLARQQNAHLTNVRWLLGDGASLADIPNDSADVCFSHVVFQHIPDPQITLRYVEEMGRVLRHGGWAAFQVSNRPETHERRPLFERVRSLPGRLLGRRPRGQSHRAWLGSAVSLDDLVAAAHAGGMTVDRIEGRGTQWCLVLLRKPQEREAP